MANADRSHVIIHNGEIYNWPEIRNQLNFTDWRSQTDTETILQAFIERGPECLHLFNGMFAFAILNVGTGEVFVARDRIGIKPLIYCQLGQSVYFASEVKAIRAAGIRLEANETAIYDYLRWGALDHDEQTFFAGMRNLAPGTWMRLARGKEPEFGEYWSLPDIVRANRPIETDDAVRQFFDLFRDSIRLQARSDVPVGAFLSGGLDSSSVTAMLMESRQSEVGAFTYDYDTSDAGEGEHARAVADLLNVRHELCKLAWQDVPNRFSNMLYHQEAPVSSIRVLSAHQLFARSREAGYTVILEGHGGDQIGGGFHYYWMAAVMDVAMQAGGAAAYDLATAFMDNNGVPAEQRAEYLVHAMGAIAAQGTATQDGRIFIKPQLLDRDFLDSHRNRTPERLSPFGSHLLNAQYRDLRCLNLPRVLRYADRASMSVGSEARVPLLDHRIVEMCFSTTHVSRVRGTEQRYFMRQAMKSVLADKIRRTPKRSVVDPQRMWLKQELATWVSDILHSKSFAETGYFDADAVREEFQQYRAIDGLPPSGFHIFQYLNVALWHEMFIKGDAMSPRDNAGHAYSRSVS